MKVTCCVCGRKVTRLWRVNGRGPLVKRDAYGLLDDEYSRIKNAAQLATSVGFVSGR